MRLPLLLILSEVLVSSTLADIQRPLLAHQDQSRTPLDEVFDQKAKWALEHFEIPGLAVSVVRGDVFSKVSHVSQLSDLICTIIVFVLI